MQHAARQWKREKRSARLYRAVSDLESGTPRQLLFLELAQDAENEAAHWALEMKKAGRVVPGSCVPGPGERLTVVLLAWFGAASLRWLLAAWGLRGTEVFGMDVQTAAPVPDIPESRQTPAHKHSRDQLDVLYGLHDGILAQTCLLLFMAGAEVRPGFWLLAGAAGLLAGASAAAAGLMLSSRGRTAAAEELRPDLRALAEVYARRGMGAGAALQEAHRLLLDLELLDPEAAVIIRQPDVRPAVQAGVIAFFAFAAGAVVPLWPYLLEVNRHPLMMGCCLATLAVFVCGWRLAGMAGRIALWGGLRSVLAAWAGGSLSYLAGALLAVLV